MRSCFVFLIAIIFLLSCRTSFYDGMTDLEKAYYTLPGHGFKAELGHPFGTMLRLKVEVIDGREYSYKGSRSSYLMRVLEVNGEPMEEIHLFEFDNYYAPEFAMDAFELYENIYRTETGSIDSKQRTEMNKQYVGKKYTILAYETGRYAGLPRDYGKYAITPGGEYQYHFKSYLMVVKDLTQSPKENER